MSHRWQAVADEVGSTPNVAPDELVEAIREQGQNYLLIAQVFEKLGCADAAEDIEAAGHLLFMAAHKAAKELTL